MFTVITTFNRASPATPYYIDSNPTLKSQFNAFVSAHSSFLSSFTSQSPTTTTQISTAAYVDETTYQAFIDLFNAAFPTFFADRAAYCAVNNIEIVRTEETA